MWDGFEKKKSLLSRKNLRESNRLDLIRLATFIGLKRDLNEMSNRQLAYLIYWRLTR
jgi:hypothetical protein